MGALFNRLLDRLFGPRDWSVVEDEGTFYATATSRLIEGDIVVRSEMRAGPALRLSRALRQKAEDTPEPLL